MGRERNIPYSVQITCTPNDLNSKLTRPLPFSSFSAHKNTIRNLSYPASASPLPTMMKWHSGMDAIHGFGGDTTSHPLIILSTRCFVACPCSTPSPNHPGRKRERSGQIKWVVDFVRLYGVINERQNNDESQT
ncbi:uncharacterized protein BDCG_16074 [Blastomyces dermatitidis ER-3]|uniref:Uncharacterized protein n=1 Tax=Ajellomyces dermatitidis (strain ER-3 / ATCC MYA-2586) TaxID=559297 RepID=A0ABP2EQ96_AJEDR|nr:uncharacterized protein BDCG_16074 [Blastomyces dermatitidis ER-3]EEQ83427.2 hypothetical protein BDCG_16074 [Blastomyces dermatitidis ER-3]EQL35967.1 hypothetical protein BDFG_02561 [Blastomyces dermatitidis ATCC 26199]